MDKNIIYKITNTITGEVYIGQTKKRLTHRKFDHEYEAFKRQTKGKLYNAMREFGCKNFIYEKICETDSYNDLAELEKKYIKLYDCIKNGYNTQIRNDSSAIKRINKNNYKNNFKICKDK